MPDTVLGAEVDLVRSFLFSLSMWKIDFEIVQSKQYLAQFCPRTATQIAR